MMLDRNNMALRPSMTYRVLRATDLIEKRNGKPPRKARALFNHWPFTSTGMWMSAYSTWPGLSTISAPCFNSRSRFFCIHFAIGYIMPQDKLLGK